MPTERLPYSAIHIACHNHARYANKAGAFGPHWEHCNHVDMSTYFVYGYERRVVRACTCWRTYGVAARAGVMHKSAVSSS